MSLRDEDLHKKDDVASCHRQEHIMINLNENLELTIINQNTYQANICTLFPTHLRPKFRLISMGLTLCVNLPV